MTEYDSELIKKLNYEAIEARAKIAQESWKPSPFQIVIWQAQAVAQWAKHKLNTSDGR